MSESFNSDAEGAGVSRDRGDRGVTHVEGEGEGEGEAEAEAEEEIHHSNWGCKRRPDAVLSPFESKKARSTHVWRKRETLFTSLQVLSRRTGVQWSLSIMDPKSGKTWHKNSDGLAGVFGSSSAAEWLPTVYNYNAQLNELAGVARVFAVPYDPLRFQDMPGGRQVQCSVTNLLAMKACTGFAGTMLGNMEAKVEEFKQLRCEVSGATPIHISACKMTIYKYV